MSNFLEFIGFIIIVVIVAFSSLIFVVKSYSNYMVEKIEEDGYYELINNKKITFYEENKE